MLKFMIRKSIKNMAALDMEEQILNLGSFISVVSVFLPWVGGEWLGGETVTYSGFKFYTGYLGITIFLLQAFVLLLFVVPISGGPQLLRKSKKDIVRLIITCQATILSIAALSVITRATLEFTRMQIRFGFYLTIIGCLVSSLYSYLRFQDHRKKDVREMFHYPDTKDNNIKNESVEIMNHPPQSEPEKHSIHSQSI